MKFRVFPHKRANKFLEELMPENKQRIVEKLRGLEGFPETKLDKVAGEETLSDYALETIGCYSKSMKRKK